MVLSAKKDLKLKVLHGMPTNGVHLFFFFLFNVYLPSRARCILCHKAGSKGEGNESPL